MALDPNQQTPYDDLDVLLGIAPPRGEVVAPATATLPCPRCAQSDAERKRDHKTAHVKDCPNKGRGGRKLGATAAVPALAAAGASTALVETGRESAKRITQQVRAGLMATFDALGGDAALLAWARENPSRFFDMWARAVPRESEANSRAAGITVVLNTPADIRRSRQGPIIDVTPTE